VFLVAVVYDFSVTRVGVPSVCDVSCKRETWYDADGSIHMEGVPGEYLNVKTIKQQGKEGIILS
jgi:hypothetical protein